MIKFFLLFFLWMPVCVYSQETPIDPNLPIEIDIMQVFRDIDFSRVFEHWGIRACACFLAVYAIVGGIFFVYHVVYTINRAFHNVRRDGASALSRQSSGRDGVVVAPERRRGRQGSEPVPAAPAAPTAADRVKDREVRQIMLQSAWDRSGDVPISDTDRMMSREDAEREWERREKKRRDIEFAMEHDAELYQHLPVGRLAPMERPIRINRREVEYTFDAESLLDDGDRF